MKAQITDIREPMTERVSKAGKKYTAMKVAIDTGEELVEVLSFNEVKEGDFVELIKKGEYWNIVQPEKPLSAVMQKQFDIINKKLDRLLGDAD